MRALAVTLAAAVVAGVAARALLTALMASPVLRARNHRGLVIPASGGVAVVGGTLLGWGSLDLFADLAGAEDAASALPVFAMLALGFAFLGLYDDIAGAGAGRGWRAHLGAVRRLRGTSGALKITGGAALALVAAPAADGLGWSIARALLIALSANLFNLLDVRPGRATKTFLVAAVALSAISIVVAAPLLIALAAAATCLRADLRERVMLGDVGANALGAIIGTAAAIHASHVALVTGVLLLAALHVVGDRPGLSRLIDAIAPLRAADRAGRVVG